MKDHQDICKPTRRWLTYLVWWVITWLLVILTSQVPKLYDLTARDSWSDALSRAAVLFVLASICGVVWALVSWPLQWLAQWLLGLGWRRGGALRNLAAAAFVAVTEYLALARPLGGMNRDMYAHPFHHDGNDPVISAASVTAETLGILLAFPLACMIAGVMLERRPRSGKVAAAP